MFNEGILRICTALRSTNENNETVKFSEKTKKNI